VADGIFDRLSSLIRSLMQDDGGPRTQRPADPDLADAMDELDDFLGTGRDPEPEPETRRGPDRPGTPPRRPAVPEDVVQAYKNLETPPGATMEELRASYRRMMRMYHPDKHTDNA